MASKAMLSEKDRQEIRRIAKRHRSRANIVNAASVPNKGDDDAYGNPFSGLSRQKIADNAIGSIELGPDTVLNSHIGEQIQANKLPGLGSMSGQAGPNQVPPLGSLNGQASANQVPPIGQLNGTLSYQALSDKPNLSRFLTSKDIENRATHAWVKHYVAKHVKPSARR